MNMSSDPQEMRTARPLRHTAGRLAALPRGLAEIACLGALFLLVLPVAQARLFPQSLVAARAGALCGLAVLLGIVAALFARHAPHAGFGPANAVTLARAALVALMATALFGPPPPPGWTLVAVAVGCLSLDGIDGWLARRTAMASAFGARFDMETDAALALVLAALAADRLGGWVLALGLARYAFVAATWAWPWLARPLPDRLSRKAVCVLQIGALIALQAPSVPTGAAVALAALTATALAWSFGRDVLWLRAARD